MVSNTCNKVANALTKLALLNDFSRRQSHMIVIVIIVLIFYLMHLIGWENLTKKEVAITSHNKANIAHPNSHSILHNQQDNLIPFEEMSDNVKVSYDFLPVEIVTNILLLLPTKSIITCICVSKTWKSIIQNPIFISTNLHLSIKSHNNKLTLFRLCPQKFGHQGDHKEVYTLHNDEDDDDLTEHTRFDFPLHGPDLRAFKNDRFRVVGTCNGLVCLYDLYDYLGTDSDEELFLWNPCVRKFVKLPSPNFTLLKPHAAIRTHAFIGFGFDSKTNDYKVVRVLCHKGHPNIPEDQPEVEDFSLSTGKWRIVTVSPPRCTLVQNSASERFVNGALHWVAFRRTDDNNLHCFILVFDLGNEVFHEIVLPEILDFTGCASISVYGNSIAFFHMKFLSISYRQIIWVMKEYGVASSWTKVLTIHNNQVPGYAIGFRRNGEVLLNTKKCQYASLDLENQKMKDLRISSHGFTLVGSYVESLVFLDIAANGTVTY
jgi:F-box interacting protein